ncbi:DMT family transporter [Roseibium album]|uniref:DMT family transporter n=1 Tax=Roseibium album TaxID=311410 RepID=UPI000D551925|nr:DMT family transporter [Roseibium album]MBG6155119.1 drug/metabolite transporter (DMT)-like permease [Labrenzia sp. EL_162]MBG6162378.1 drug/metabolite transporter (DMT)-like permease [Labrenzia sp. EL_195]MBG6192751.1 drug/metabolite transporter (DMT)-like permease [Labrenzia sp. EL_159]MCR9060395.1 DMT family transporter [Paracoccaceae bacterium]
MFAIARRFGDLTYGNAFVMLTLTTLFWGGNTIAGRLAVGEVSPMMVVFLRWLIVAAIFVPLFWSRIRSDWPLMRPYFARMILMAAFGFVGFNSLFYIAATQTTAVNLGIIQGSVPIIVLIGSVIAFGTKVRVLQVLGILLTLVGVTIIAAQGSLDVLLALAVNPGDGYMLLSCVLYSGYALALRDRPKISGLTFFAVLSGISVLASIPGLIFEVSTGTAQLPSFDGWLVVLYIAVFPSCLSQIFFMRGVDLIGPARAGVFVNLVPIFAAALAVTILNEPFKWHHGVALTMVLGGIWLSERKAGRGN